MEFKATLGQLGAGSSVKNTAFLVWSSLPGDVSLPQSEFNDLSTERDYDPPNDADIYGTGASFTIQIPGKLPSTGYAPGRRTKLDPKAGVKPYQLDDNFWLHIPSQGIHTAIVGIPMTPGGWDTTWLSNQTGFLEGTAYPTWTGNTVLTSHAYLPSGDPGPFVNLGQLSWGDTIVITNGSDEYVYEVRERAYIAPDDFSSLQSESYDWVTLITCYRYDESLGDYRWRIAVRAVLIEKR